MLPSIFRSLRLLRALNALAVGAALGASSGAVLAPHFFGYSALLGERTFGEIAFAVAGPSCVLGSVWAALLRRKPIRGWVSSFFLAAANAGTAFALLTFFRGTGVLNALLAFLFAATFGVFYWLPALAVTLAVFGLPIAYARRLAGKGLAGEERGERFVGIASALAACVGLLLTRGTGSILLYALGGTAVGAGGLAAILAHARDRRRKAFVAMAAEGRIPGYRVDESAEGRVLVRVTNVGGGYRIAEEHQALVELDPQGDATRALM